MRKHWQDWGNLVLGLWVFISPWILQHTMATGTEAAGAVTGTMMWNLYIVGIAIAAVALAALLAFRAWEEWISLALGAWLFASPWVLGFSTSALLMWNAIIVGALVIALAGQAISATQTWTQGPAERT